MPEAKCRVCKIYFEYDPNDIRPCIWHDYPDGTIVVNDNPNLKHAKKLWPKPTMPKKKTFWLDFE